MGDHVFQRCFGVFLSLICTITFSFAFAKAEFDIETFIQSNVQVSQNHKYAQKLLKQLGFVDYVDKIDLTLNSSSTISDVSKLALKKSKTYLASVNASRELAAFLFAVISKTKISEAEINAIEKMIIQQLRPFPMIHFEPVPQVMQNEIKNLNLASAIEKKRGWANQRAVERFTLEKNNLRQLFLMLGRDLANDDSIKPQLSQWLEKQIAAAIKDPYTYGSRQQNRFLGHALVLSYVGFVRRNHWDRLEARLKQNMKSHGLYLESYTQAYYVHALENEDLRAYSLKSGDVALEYYHGQEAYFTSLVIEPSHKENKEIADKHKLHTNLHNAIRFLDTARFYTVLDKIEVSHNLTATERSIYKEFWNQDYARGFSHSGLVRVHRDEETGLKMAWIWDAYPERDKVGPIRLMTVQGFAYPERMMRLGFLRYSPYKVFDSFRHQIQKRGYLKTVWNSNGSFVGTSDYGSIIPSQDEDYRYDWPTHVSETKVQQWMKSPTVLADSWFENELMPNVFERLEDYLAGPNATLFADGFSNGKDLLYCSQMIVMAFLQGGNFDIQETPDQVWTLITYFSDQVKSALKLSIGQRLVSPNGLVWQKNIFQNLFQVPLTRSTTRAQMQLQNPTWAQGYTIQLNQVIEEFKKSLQFKWQDTKPALENKIESDEIVFDVET